MDVVSQVSTLDCVGSGAAHFVNSAADGSCWTDFVQQCIGIMELQTTQGQDVFLTMQKRIIAGLMESSNNCCCIIGSCPSIVAASCVLSDFTGCE